MLAISNSELTLMFPFSIHALQLVYTQINRSTGDGGMRRACSDMQTLSIQANLLALLRHPRTFHCVQINIYFIWVICSESKVLR